MAGTAIGFKYTPVNSTSGTYYYYGVNSRGDVEALYNADGTLHAKYEYDAFGKLISVKASDGTSITATYAIAVLNPLRYRSYVYDNETGLYYLQSRYYDPTTCRFINADVYYETGQGINGYNMFAYCNNNPVMYIDYFGTDAMVLFDDTGFGHIGALIQDDDGTWYHFYYGAPNMTALFSLTCYVYPDTWCIKYTGKINIDDINASGQYHGTYSDSVLLYGDFSAALDSLKISSYVEYNAFKNNCSQYTFEVLSSVDNYNSDLLKQSSEISYDPIESYSYFKARAIDYPSDSYKIDHILTVKEKRLCKM